MKANNLRLIARTALKITIEIHLLYFQKYSPDKNFAVSQFFCQFAKFNSREYQNFLPTVNLIPQIAKIFWTTAKFISTKF